MAAKTMEGGSQYSKSIANFGRVGHLARPAKGYRRQATSYFVQLLSHNSRGIRNPDEKDWQYDDNKSATADANGTIDIEIGLTINRKGRDYSRMLQYSGARN